MEPFTWNVRGSVRLWKGALLGVVTTSNRISTLPLAPVILQKLLVVGFVVPVTVSCLGAYTILSITLFLEQPLASITPKV